MPTNFHPRPDHVDPDSWTSDHTIRGLPQFNRLFDLIRHDPACVGFRIKDSFFEIRTHQINEINSPGNPIKFALQVKRLLPFTYYRWLAERIPALQCEDYGDAAFKVKYDGQLFIFNYGGSERELDHLKRIVANAPKEWEEGAACLKCAVGSLEWEQEPCYCNAVRMAPCAACENATLTCNNCGATPEDAVTIKEEKPMNNSDVNLILITKGARVVRIDTGSAKLLVLDALNIRPEADDLVVINTGKFGTTAKVKDADVPISELKGNYGNLHYITCRFFDSDMVELEDRISNLEHELALAELKRKLEDRDDLKAASLLLDGPSEEG